MIDRHPMLFVIPVIAAGALVACSVPVMQVGDKTINKAHGEEAMSQVKTRAAFDLDCPKDKIELSVLGTVKVIGEPEKVNQIGASGCDHKAVYVNVEDYGHKWVQNGGSEKAK